MSIFHAANVGVRSAMTAATTVPRWATCCSCCAHRESSHCGRRPRRLWMSDFGASTRTWTACAALRPGAALRCCESSAACCANASAPATSTLRRQGFASPGCARQFVEMQIGRLTLDLAGLEQGCARWMQAAVLDELLDRAVALVVWVDLDERFGPVTTKPVLFDDSRGQVRCSDPGKAAREGGVLVDETVAEVEDVFHLLFSLGLAGSR